MLSGRRAGNGSIHPQRWWSWMREGSSEAHELALRVESDVEESQVVELVEHAIVECGIEIVTTLEGSSHAELVERTSSIHAPLLAVGRVLDVGTRVVPWTGSPWTGAGRCRWSSDRRIGLGIEGEIREVRG